MNNLLLYRIVIGQYLNHDGIVISHLNISSVRTSDGGLYKCIASNTIERVGHTSRLNVYGKGRHYFIKDNN